MYYHRQRKKEKYVWRLLDGFSYVLFQFDRIWNFLEYRKMYFSLLLYLKKKYSPIYQVINSRSEQMDWSFSGETSLLKRTLILKCTENIHICESESVRQVRISLNIEKNMGTECERKVCSLPVNWISDFQYNTGNISYYLFLISESEAIITRSLNKYRTMYQ